MGRCEKCIHYCICMVNSYWHESCGYYEPARPVGEWIEVNSTDLKCSICGHRELKEYTLVTFLNYCSLCGAKMGLIDDAADTKPDLEYLKVGNTIYTQDDDKQGWTGREG